MIGEDRIGSIETVTANTECAICDKDTEILALKNWVDNFPTSVCRKCLERAVRMIEETQAAA